MTDHARAAAERLRPVCYAADVVQVTAIIRDAIDLATADRDTTIAELRGEVAAALKAGAYADASRELTRERDEAQEAARILWEARNMHVFGWNDFFRKYPWLKDAT